MCNNIHYQNRREITLLIKLLFTDKDLHTHRWTFEWDVAWESSYLFSFSSRRKKLCSARQKGSFAGRNQSVWKHDTVPRNVEEFDGQKIVQLIKERRISRLLNKERIPMGREQQRGSPVI